MSRWSSFFCDHRLSRPIIPPEAARSRFCDLISKPSFVPKAALRQETLSGHWKHALTISLNPSSPTGKTLFKTPKQSLFTMTYRFENPSPPRRKYERFRSLGFIHYPWMNIKPKLIDMKIVPAYDPHLWIDLIDYTSCDMVKSSIMTRSLFAVTRT